jgi:glycosyltransferase involved in cell wall biosynthesis
MERLLDTSPCKLQIQLLKSSENVGYIDTLKYLIESAQTDIVAVLDADDALEPEATSELLLAYRRIPRAGLVCSKYYYMGRDMRVRFATCGSCIPPGKTLLTGGDFCHIRSFRRELYYQTSGFDSNLLYAEDRDILYKLEEWTKPLFIDKPLYRYRYVPHSQSQDLVKRQIGYESHYRAWTNALRRRGVQGIRWSIAASFYWLRHKSAEREYLKRLFPPLFWLQERMGILKFGEMNRSDRWHR